MTRMRIRHRLSRCDTSVDRTLSVYRPRPIAQLRPLPPSQLVGLDQLVQEYHVKREAYKADLTQACRETSTPVVSMVARFLCSVQGWQVVAALETVLSPKCAAARESQDTDELTRLHQLFEDSATSIYKTMKEMGKRLCNASTEQKLRFLKEVERVHNLHDTPMSKEQCAEHFKALNPGQEFREKFKIDPTVVDPYVACRIVLAPLYEDLEKAGASTAILDRFCCNPEDESESKESLC